MIYQWHGCLLVVHFFPRRWRCIFAFSCTCKGRWFQFRCVHPSLTFLHHFFACIWIKNKYVFFKTSYYTCMALICNMTSHLKNVKKEDVLTLWRDSRGRLLCVFLLRSFLLLGFQLGESVALSTVTAMLGALFAGFQSSCFFLGVPPAWRAVGADNGWHTKGHGHSERLRYVDRSALMPRRGLQREEASREGGPRGAVVGGARVQHPPVFRRGGLVAAEVITFEHLQLLWQCFLRGCRGSWWLLLVQARAPASCCPASFDPFNLPVLVMFAQVKERVRAQRSGFYIWSKNAAGSTSWTVVSCSVIICAVKITQVINTLKKKKT